jgi:hypothetical protein
MVRQILGAVAEFEKASLVAKLRHARDRWRADTGKCGGRKSLADLDPAAVDLARRLSRRSPKTGKRRSLRQIADLLAEAGHRTRKGTVYSASAIQSMIDGP